MTYCKLSEKPIIVFDFESLLLPSLDKILNELFTCKLLKNNIIVLNSDCRKIFYHHIIQTLCDSVINLNTSCKKIILIQPYIIKHHDIFYYYDKNKLLNIINSIIRKIQKMLPLNIFLSKKAIDFKIFENKYLCGPGENRELTYLIEESCTKFDDQVYTFEHVKKFANKFGLIFLSKNYFNSLKIKQLLY